MRTYLLLIFIIVSVKSLYIYINDIEYKKFPSPICEKFNHTFKPFWVDLVINESVSNNKSKFGDKVIIIKTPPHYLGFNEFFKNYSTSKGIFFVENDLYGVPGMTCLHKIHNSGDSSGRKFIIGVFLNSTYQELKKLADTNGTIDEHGNTFLRAYIMPPEYERNEWVEVRKYLWVLVAGFIVIFLSAIVLAGYHLYWQLFGKPFQVNVAVVCLINIMIANLIRTIYYFTGPYWYYDIIEEDYNLIFVTCTWPFSLFNLLLISLFWEGLLSNKKSFMNRCFKLWIGICVAIFVLTLIPTFLMVFAENISSFIIFVYITIGIQIGLGSLNVIYSIINTIRFTKLMSNMQDPEEKKIKLRRSSISIIIANIGEILFIIILIFIPSLVQNGFHYRLWMWSIMWFALLICDVGIIFTFASKQSNDPSDDNSSNTQL